MYIRSFRTHFFQISRFMETKVTLEAKVEIFQENAKFISVYE